MKRLLLGISLFVSLWLLSQTLNPEPARTKSTPEQTTLDDSKLQADNFMYDIELKEFSSDGHLKARLTTPEMIQFTGQSYAEISTPVVVLSDSANASNSSGARWDLTSEAGLYDLEHKNIEFRGSVSLSQKEADTTLLELTTEELVYQIQNELLRTQTPVSVKHTTGQYQASELSLDLKTQELYLGKGVRADYES